MGYKMLENVLSNFKNTMTIINICFFLIFIFVKQRVFQAKKAVFAIESRAIELQKESEMLEVELSYLTNPDRLKAIYYSLAKDRDSEHIANIDEISTVNNFLNFYLGQHKKNTSFSDIK
jgi:cell division protein FtsL